jgi:hypothetical protein
MLESEHDIEIYYGLHEGDPILIGGGSFEDLDRIDKEAQAIDEHQDRDSTAIPPHQTRHSQGTRHFYHSLGQVAGVAVATEAAMNHYKNLVQESRKALRQRIRNNNK